MQTWFKALTALIGFWLGAVGAADADAPVGLWVWSAEPPSETVEVRLARSGDVWTATIDGGSAPVRMDGEALVVDGPDERFLTLRRRLADTGLAGVWTQPLTVTDYGRMATPVLLVEAGEDEWSGRLTVQARPYRLFLDVFETEPGRFEAVIRNPERNDVMGRTRFDFEPDGADRWRLVAGEGERRLEHLVTRSPEGLVLRHNRVEAPVTLRRAEAADRAAYDPAPAERGYTPPPSLDDGWTVANAEDVGFDVDALDALVAELSTSDPRSRRPRLVHSMLVARHGRLVFEEYFYGHDRTMRHDTRSLGKVFAPVLIGALQQQGVAISAEDRPIPALLAAAGEAPDDPRKADITLAQLMSFTSGLDCDVANPESAGNEDAMWSQQGESDFWLYTARLPLIHAPGTRYAYCSGSINLAGAAITQAGGSSVLQLFDTLIAEPLDFGPYHWNLAPNGAAYLGGGSYMLPRDLLKIGVLHAESGVWNGQRILPEAWVNESTTPVMEITPETTGMTPEAFANNYFPGGAAAYEWVAVPVTTPDRAYDAYQATGNGGQVLVVVPELDLTVLITGGNYSHGGVWGRWRDELVGGHVIPALADRP